MEKQPILKIKFISTDDYVPDTIPTAYDERTFLFVKGGIVYSGYHYDDDVFKDMECRHITAEAWIEWEETR